MARVLISQMTADGRWADLGLRLASAAVLAPLALLALWAGGWAWTAVIAVSLAGLGAEWAALAGRGGLALPAALLLALAAALAGGWWLGFAVLAGATLLAAGRLGWFAAAGIPYAGIGGLALLWLRLAPAAGLRDVILLLAVIWATDTGAYLAGRMLGGARLAPRISPGKTWSGAAGGLASAGVAGWVLAGDLRGVAVALLLSVLAQAGDLLESAIKRRVGVKDSGRTIPGHGGLFDRLDGFLAAGPLAALLASGVHGGLPLWR